MTGMLASVMSIAEAELVLNQGVDIIDLKNPHEGALGALDVGIVSEIVTFVGDAILTSATIGDVEPNDLSLHKHIVNMANTGVHFVKVGLFDSRVTQQFIQAINSAANQGVNIIVVLFAENIPGMNELDGLMNSDIKGLMFDTKNKSDKSLCSLLNLNVLEDFIQRAKAHRLLTGLAGSLQLDDIDSLLKLGPDYLGFRGALCNRHDRVQAIDPNQVKKIRNAIPQEKIIGYADRAYEKEILSNGTVA